MCPTNCVLRITSMGRHHLMKSSHSISGLKLAHALAHFLHDTRDIITLIHRRLIGHPFWPLPVGTPLVLQVFLEASVPGTFQSLGLLPEYMTLVTTWPGLGLGTGESIIWTFGPLPTTASFIVVDEALRIWDEIEEMRAFAEDSIECLCLKKRKYCLDSRRLDF